MRIKVNGEEVEVTQVGTISETETWNEYQLENGDRVRMKTVAKKILKVNGTKDQYVIQSQNILDVHSAPDK